jgi:hypothetical protein
MSKKATPHHTPKTRRARPSAFRAQTKSVLQARIRHVLKQARSPKTSGPEFTRLMREVLTLEHQLAHLR